MPDHHLDRRLADERRDVLDRIEMPEIGEIRGRARAVRRRRHALASGVAALCLGLLGTGGSVVYQSLPPEQHLAAVPTPTFQGWHGGGLTLLALTAQVLDLPGELYDVQFADRRTGYALSRACGGGAVCQLDFAITRDGGETWSAVAPPQRTADSSADPELVTVGTAGVGLALGDQAWFLKDGTRSWAPSTVDIDVPEVPPGARLWQRHHEACTAGPVEVWLPDGRRSRLANQPGLAVCRVGSASTGDGAWWVSGTATTVDGSGPAVAATRDNGRTWTVAPLSGPSGFAQVSTLGTEVYATVVGPADGKYAGQAEVRAVYRSVNRGPFQPYGQSGSTLVGDVVPLLDGRLVTAGPGWLVAAGRGEPFHEAGGTLPRVSRIQRTPGFWVAYNLFENGWAAVSVDGAIWQKINLR